MTSNEIIEVLKCCKAGDCDNCPFYGVKEDCEVELPGEVLDFVNQQNAEIERLLRIIADKEYSCVGLVSQLEITNELLKTAKSEAIKEFADRLCDGRVSNDPVVIAVKVELEMMKEKEMMNNGFNTCNGEIKGNNSEV